MPKLSKLFRPRQQGGPEERFGLFEFPGRPQSDSRIDPGDNPQPADHGPANDNNCSADTYTMYVIAVHGLGGHWKTTWRAGDGDDAPIWLRDRLPAELESIGVKARILSYGYDSNIVFTTSVMDIDYAARILLDRLRGCRKTDQQKRTPILFVAHSLGGLVVKKAMILAWANSHHYAEILEKVKGCLFLGVPHQGADLAYWADMPARIVPLVTFGFFGNRRFLKSLKKKSKDWMQISRDFVHRSAQLHIRSFFETEKLGDVVVVDERSAVISLPNEVALPLAGSDHETICKFGDKEHQRYSPIRNAMEELGRLALGGESFLSDKSFTLTPSWANVTQDVQGHSSTTAILANNATSADEPTHEFPQGKLSSDHRACLRSLFFKEMDFSQSITSAADNTCGWLHTHQIYREWLQSHSSILWIKGEPGAGKSTLLKYALKQGPGNAIVASFFFNGRGSPIEKSALGLYRSILYQLLPLAVNQLSSLTQVYWEKCQLRGGFGEEWNWHEEELEDWVKALLLFLADQPVRIYIDALDEGGDKVARQVMGWFKELVSEATHTGKSLSICFSCRHYPTMTLDYGLEIVVENENASGIVNYIRRMFENSGIEGEKAQVLEKEIARRAKGLFMWVSIVVPRVVRQYLGALPWQALLAELERLPQKLHRLYESMLRDIPAEERIETLRLMQWACLALRPLSLLEMRFALIVGSDTQCDSLGELTNADSYLETDEDMKRRVTYLSRGLAGVKVRSGREVIECVHQSVEHYLVDEGGMQILDKEDIGNTFCRGHFYLSWTCARYLAMREILSLKDDDIGMDREAPTTYSASDHDGDSICQHTLEQTYPLISYATLSWVEHVRIAAKGLSQDALLQVFRRFHPASNMRMKQWLRLYPAFQYRQGLLPAKGTTIFHIVARYGFSHVLSVLLDADDTEVDSVDDDAQTPLLWAAMEGHEAVVQLLIARADIKVEAKDRIVHRTPLSWAAWGGHPAVVKRLLAHPEVDTDWKDCFGMTPLSWAAFGGQKEVVELLLLPQSKVDVNSKDVYEQTPLSKAAQSGHYAIAKMLLDHNNVDPDSKDIDGRTPLSWAAGEGHQMVEQLLADQSANFSVTDPDGTTFFHRRPLESGEEEEDPKRPLFSNDPVVRPSEERWASYPLYVYTGLFSASRYWTTGEGHKEIARLLLSRGADLDSMDRQGRTPLSWAAERGHRPIVGLLLNHQNIKLDAPDTVYGRTPLAWATGSGHEAVAELLIAHGATVGLTDVNRTTSGDTTVEEMTQEWPTCCNLMLHIWKEATASQG